MIYKLGYMGQHVLLLDNETKVTRLFDPNGKEVPITTPTHARLIDVSVITLIVNNDSCAVFDGHVKKVFDNQLSDKLFSTLASENTVSRPLALDKKGFKQHLFCYPINFDTKTFISTL